MRIIITHLIVDAALKELGCMNDAFCSYQREPAICAECRQRAEQAVRAAVQEIFPKARVEIAK